MHRLTWAPMLLGTHGNCPSCPCVKAALSPSSVLSLITAELLSPPPPSSSHWKLTCFSPWYSWKIAELALNNNHSLTLVLATLSKYLPICTLRVPYIMLTVIQISSDLFTSKYWFSPSLLWTILSPFWDLFNWIIPVLLCNLAVCIMVSSLKLPTSVKSDKTFGLTVSIPTSACPLSVSFKTSSLCCVNGCSTNSLPPESTLHHFTVLPLTTTFWPHVDDMSSYKNRIKTSHKKNSIVIKFKKTNEMKN